MVRFAEEKDLDKWNNNQCIHICPAFKSGTSSKEVGKMRISCSIIVENNS